MQRLKVGIASHATIRERARAIARGERPQKPGEPRVWFTSLEQLTRTLSVRNRGLLAVIATTEPDSLETLAKTLDRSVGDLSRELRALEHFGIVRMRKRPGNRLKPELACSGLVVEVPLP